MTASDPCVLAQPGTAQRLDLPVRPTVVRVLENNPGMFTGPGTNTFVIGDASVWVLDPGEDRDDGHRAAILDAVGGRPVDGVLVSHAHPDHWPLAVVLGAEWRVPTYAFPNTTSDFAADRALSNGEVLAGSNFSLRCVHTPGHCADHLSFVLDDGQTTRPIVFCGDHVMAWSTTILAPPDGSLNHYLASLDALMTIEAQMLLPAHGAAIRDPQSRMAELKAHRLERSRQLLDVLATGPLSLEDAVPLIYTDTDPQLFGAAAASLQAHADALVEDGKLRREGDAYRRIDAVVSNDPV